MIESFKTVRNDDFGFYQVTPMPSVEELDKFYNSNYYDVKGYSKKYSEKEEMQKRITAFEIDYVCENLKGRKVLDIGCGEGFVLDEMQKKGWTVAGLDFSHDGVSRHFPHLVKNVIKGDIYKSLDQLMEQKEKFDVIICNNVLEHVLDPLAFLVKFKNICYKDTVVRIQVPNDFSWFQKALQSESLIKNEYWVAPPGHLSYFSQESLVKTLEHFGYKTFELLGDFPIEMFLLNSHSNYNLAPETGPQAHHARVQFEVSLLSHSLEKLIAFRKGCGQSGVCRNLIAYCRLDLHD